jgi:hypothetical protein
VSSHAEFHLTKPPSGSGAALQACRSQPATLGAT